jgi:signal transduction histidine kinase
MYIPETGMTPLKFYLEFFIVSLQVLTAVLFTRIYLKTEQEHYIYFIAALILSIYSELFFMFHYSYDTGNLLGHVYKVGMFYLIYQTIFTDSIKKPYWQLMEAKKQLKLNMYSLEKKVRERTRDLAAQKKELERLNRLKTDLLAVCSHDMKSPIQGTILMLDLLMMEAEGRLTAEQKKTLLSIRKNEEAIMALITNLLDVARRDEDAMVVHPESTDVNGLLHDWSERQRVITDTMGITFHAEVEDGGPLLYEVDAFKINQVLNNLMSNALKFTPYGGDIKLAAVKTLDGGLRVSLSNSGPVIEKDKLTKIFERYVQASDCPEAGSTGLGLNIAKTIIEMHGGSIWAESEEGRGTAFTFTLPANRPLSAEGTRPDVSGKTRLGDAA